MASSVTVLAWGMMMFKDAYESAEEWQNALDMLKWATDYFLKAHTSKYEFYGQVAKLYWHINLSLWSLLQNQTHNAACGAAISRFQTMLLQMGHVSDSIV